MSYQSEHYRRTMRERIQRDAGGYRGGAPTTLGELKRWGLDTELFNEPEEIDLVDSSEIQGPGGGWSFMLDVSELDGDDPLQ